MPHRPQRLRLYPPTAVHLPHMCRHRAQRIDHNACADHNVRCASGLVIPMCRNLALQPPLHGVAANAVNAASIVVSAAA